LELLPLKSRLCFNTIWSTKAQPLTPLGSVAVQMEKKTDPETGKFGLRDIEKLPCTMLLASQFISRNFYDEL